MAKKQKNVEVQKFGGIEQMGTAHLENKYDVQSVEAQSDTKLEHDEGYGDTIVIRCFEFGMNLESFKHAQPTQQELFNSHYKGIELALWRDGLKVFPDVHPRIVFDKENMRYQIFVAAKPAYKKALIQHEDGGFITPKTLSEIAHG